MIRLRRCVELATLLLAAAGQSPLLANEQPDRVKHVYVIRRALSGQPITSVGVLAHSALLLKTERGEFYTLEYMGDARAHLTKGKPEELAVIEPKKVALIKMRGRDSDRERTFVWERQLAGSPLRPRWTPEELRGLMASLMNGYEVFSKEHCHTAQERVRKELGIFDVRDES